MGKAVEVATSGTRIVPAREQRRRVVLSSAIVGIYPTKTSSAITLVAIGRQRDHRQAVIGIGTF